MDYLKEECLRQLELFNDATFRSWIRNPANEPGRFYPTSDPLHRNFFKMASGMDEYDGDWDGIAFDDCGD